MRAYARRCLEKIRAIPGIVSVGVTDSIPFGGHNSDSVILAEGYVMKPGESVVSPNQIVVTEGYFESMHVPLIEGRFFDSRDAADSPRVLIIDERLARKFWPGSSPIGKRMWRPNGPEDLVQPSANSRWFTVVGVVGNVKLRALVDPDERVGAYYFPYEQSPRDDLTFALRIAAEPSAIVAGLRKALLEIDAELPLFDLQTMTERIEESLVTRKSPMLLAMGFGAIALLLSGVGIYGVMAYMVAQRTREIGIRIALGSSAERIFRMILGEGILLLAIGFALGLGGIFALAKYVESILFGVRPMNPIVLASVAGILAAVALVACTLPARRATKVDPITALRQE
jgi:predicted permease